MVHAVVPHVPLDVIAEDLRLTHSVEFTLERIIEGQVIIPDQNAQNDHVPLNSPSQNNNNNNNNNFNRNFNENNNNDNEVIEVPKPIFAQNKEERQHQLNARKRMLKEAARKFVFIYCF